MKILYGVCGEGFGHSSIASEVIPFLEKKGHEVKIITYGKGVEFLKDFDLFEVEGFRFNYSRGAIDFPKTILVNLRDFPRNFFKRKEITEFVDSFNPDLCITDNEPIVARISYSRKLPLISFSALNSFTYNDVKKPVSKLHQSLLAKAFTRTVIPRADVTIGLSLIDKTFRKDEIIFTSPIIRKKIRKLKPTNGRFVLAYLAKSHDHLVDFFEKTGEKFVVYGVDRKDTKKIKFEKNSENFAKDFTKCKAIITNAGFSVLAEAVYLQKPIFMIPVRGFYEQFYNCLVAKKKGVGTFSERPTFEEIGDFLENLEMYQNKIEFDPQEPLRVIDEAIEKCAR